MIYLIATIDDHSRFILSGKWFRKQTKINVFGVWYHTLCHWELPCAMLQDKGRVMRDSTISLYGYRYRVPAGYINCRIWVKIIGDKVIFEAMGKIVWRQGLKV